MNGQPWTQAQLDLLVALYPTQSAPAIAKHVGRNVASIYAKANQLGMHKSRDVIAQLARERSSDPSHGGHATLFKPGQVSWNNGIKGATGLHPNCRP